ncbi:hypothetical protein ARMSODRAFT_1008013 [Armillaria solidipes]|uniref:Uncharacterized protein n=1 Tax=Armillaria solidipes TaxID=1076256 RepID=A0A2H3B9W5_9AGAR|nr:hypothetical protein ARMSODRAFT_1008013 [Armillaria solidipes]
MHLDSVRKNQDALLTRHIVFPTSGGYSRIGEKNLQRDQRSTCGKPRNRLCASFSSTSSSFRRILTISTNGPSSSDPGHSQTIYGDDDEETKERASKDQEHVLEVEAEEGKSEQKQALPNASAKKIFGTMRRPNLAARKGNDAYNYEEKYPEDAPYEETAPNARVWRTYEDESRIHDANMVEESRDNVDVLLVFDVEGGPFLGSRDDLCCPNIPEPAGGLYRHASLLFELVLVQRAIANGSLVDAISSSPLNPTTVFVPATTDV